MQTQSIKINPHQIQFLRPLDELMKVYGQSDKKYFCALFQRKNQLISNFLSTGIDSEKYFALISKVFKSESSQKEYARAELLVLKNKHQLNKEAWFQQIISQTQLSLTQQQKKYNFFQNQNKSQQLLNKQKTPPIKLNLNLVQFINFKLLDEFMQKYYETPYRQNFTELYEKKLKIFQAVQEGKINGELYFGMSKKALAQTQNQEVRDTLKIDMAMLEDLFDGNKVEWLKSSFKETKKQLPKQKQIYELHKKGAIVSKKLGKQDIDIDRMMQVMIPDDVDLNDCISFVVLDKFMSQSKNKPERYIILYQKKQKLKKLCNEGKLNQKTYKQMIKKKKETVQNEILKELYETDLTDIEDVHGGNQKAWFQHIINETDISSMIQEDIYQDFKSKAPKQIVQKKLEKSNKNINKSDQKKVDDEPILNFQKLFNLLAIEEALQKYKENNDVFIRLFAQKEKIIEMMKNGQLDAIKYRQVQQQVLKQFSNIKEIKQNIEYDLRTIHDFHDGDVNKWFEQSVEAAGKFYQTQTQKFNQLAKSQQNLIPKKANDSQLKNKKSEIVSKLKSSIKQKQAIQKEEDKPFNIAKMLSLKVLQDSLNQYTSNQILFIKLFAQKIKILQMMKNQTLDPQKYKKLQQQMLIQFSYNEQIKDSISFQLDAINDLHDGDLNKWFEEVVYNSRISYQIQLSRYQQLLDKHKNQGQSQQNLPAQSPKIKMKSESTKDQFDSKVSQAQNHINQGTFKSKIRFYLQQISTYESLSRYFQEHNINCSKNEMLKIYQTVPRQQMDQIISQIKQNPDYDIVSYCKKFFPPVTSSIFYKGAQNLDEQLKKGILACNKQIELLKDYSKLLRKALNSKNLKKVEDRIITCQENIKYLNDFSANLKKQSRWVPLPGIEILSVNYPNMDEITQLEHNQIQLKILNTQGINNEQLFKVYFLGQKMQQLRLKNGTQNIVIKGKIQSADDFMKVLKGDLKCFTISIYKKNFFSSSKQGQEGVQVLFIRTNIHAGKLTIANATIHYEARVRMPKNPIMTSIKQVNITKYPPYQYSKEIQKELLTKYSLGKEK